MKAVLCVIVLLAGSLIRSYSGFAQDGGDPASSPAPYRTAHYEIYGGGPAAAERLAAGLEACFDIYTRLFRFRFESPLRVRLIPDPASYDGYVAGLLGESREGAVYLHYRQESRRELVVNCGPAEGGGPPAEGLWNRALPYQAFIQYLRAFIPGPPSWIQRGFALYFSGLSFSGAGEVGYQENLSWLEAAKAGPLPPVRDILLADAAENRESAAGPGFDALSWSLASFFLNSGNEDHFRSLLECFMLLSREAGAAENSLILADRLGEWNGFENLDRDYRAYLDSRRTFSELMDLGRRSYLAGEGAQSFFQEARDLRPASPAPYYYLGLTAYGAGDWEEAERLYLQSLEAGAERGPVYYALGLNAAAALRRDKAREYLEAAAAADPGRYREKAAALLQRLPAR
jgi:tetratricopeptide (TPR) repeat protein